MDSDSSFDEDFELKHESEMKLQEDKLIPECEQSNDSESPQEPEHVLTESNSCDPVRKDKEVPLLNNSELGSNYEDAWSNISSDCSKASALGTDSNVKLELEGEKHEEMHEIKECRSVSSIYDERIKSQTLQGKDDTLDIPSHNEDFSCVSDSESNDGTASVNILSDGLKNDDKNNSIISINKRKESNPTEDMEQLDFEAEEVQDKEEKEEGECEVKDDRSDEGELEGDDLEEGELTDEDENRPEETEPRPICRFYSRGQCTWGSSCRFVHPGVTDKGNYTMFDVVRPLVPANGLSSYPPMDYRALYDKPSTMVYQSPLKEEPVVFESAWERGLRQAKEMMRKSNQRKETDMDFEEKKMNLSLGQEELDKENDYYIRSASPVYKEEERWNMELDPYCYRDDVTPFEHYDDLSELSYYPRNRSTGRDYWRRVHYEPDSSRTIRVDSEYVSSRRERSSSSKYHPHHQHRQTSQEVYDKYEKKSSRQKSHPSRIVASEPVEKHRREDRYGEVPVSNRRGDEWADPWMRSKSPVGRKSGNHVSRHRSNSSGSPRSSSGRSRSSSQSSHHSVSHSSRNRTQVKKSSYSQSSSRTISSHSRKPGRPLLPTPKTIESSPHQSLGTTVQRTLKHSVESRDFGKNKPLSSSFIQSEKKAASERALLMNPPAPSPQRQREIQPHSPAMMRRSAQNPPPPASPARSNSSVSSSGSDSSGSSSDSSESSCSSSSSSREPSPKVVYPPKRMIMEERGRLALAAESLKVKAMDALKLSGQKQQIKLTLKTSSNIQNKSKTVAGLPDLPQLNLVRKDRVPVLVGKKRPAEALICSDASVANKLASMPKAAPKNVTSRREELLKQLKAVEDAIARKRSKI